MVDAELAADVEPIDVWKREVEQYEVGPSLSHGVECRLAGGDVDHVELLGTQDADQWLTDSVIVLDEQHGGHDALSVRNPARHIRDRHDCDARPARLSHLARSICDGRTVTVEL